MHNKHFICDTQDVSHKKVPPPILYHMCSDTSTRPEKNHTPQRGMVFCATAFNFWPCLQRRAYFLKLSSTATATATVAPTIGLLPMPMRPIISTCAGTELEPANCASECMRPIVSVMP